MQLDRGIVRGFWLAGLLVATATCSDSEPETSSETKAVAAAPPVCNKTPIDQRGTLPACAAGTPTSLALVSRTIIPARRTRR